MHKHPCLQEPFLTALCNDKLPVSVFLVNGIKLHGVIDAFDQYVVMLKSTVTQMVYKHAISTVVPSKLVEVEAEMQENEE